ncbi:hypothetical protein GGX14DRAFT_561504 [Mycena pura]|uniref:Uncharacterized protein n=1 Tax=Mycena pura TaxID=153505 RepID=A0AAD6VLS5_9AGAR|nr:hypothetical protein GGX14DRAFT_561504 [Mycena pura]
MSLDLLRNRNTADSLGPFDGKVAALARISGDYCFITTHADYVPAVPSLQLSHAVFLRADMRYGTDDPTLWPQQWTEAYCHLPAIPAKNSRPELDVMWWDPSPHDFIVGSAVTRGLGRLHHRCMGRFLPPITDLVERCQVLMRTSKAPLSPLFGQLINNILLWTEQLQTLPTKYTKMVFGVTSLQRAVLELTALYDYTTIYRPRMLDYNAAAPAGTPIANCVGAFTTVPTVAQQLWAARLPVWFIRPTYIFDSENILAVVELQQPAFSVPDERYEQTPGVVYSGNSTSAKIEAIHHAAVHMPWYRDPFETDTQIRRQSPSPQPAAPIPTISSTTCSVPSGSIPVASSSNNQAARYSPYPSQAPQKNATKTHSGSKSHRKAQKAKHPTKIARDKFKHLEVDEMPPAISSWADALAEVDQSVIPLTNNLADPRYVLPDPAIFVNTTPERRRRYVHHWQLLSDGFIFMLSQSDSPQLMSAQHWRDILDGLTKQRGVPGSKSYRRSTDLADRIRPALEASSMADIEGLPVPLELVPEYSHDQIREIVWQVAETNFRFEFCALDRRASKRDRLDDVKNCFAGHMLIGVPLGMSQCGWAAPAIEERHRYVKRTATLMLDWVTKSDRPGIIRRVAVPVPWSPSQMQELETAVCRYYTQAFWEYFSRAAVVPLRLDHDIEKEDGQL